MLIKLKMECNLGSLGHTTEQGQTYWGIKGSW